MTRERWTSTAVTAARWDEVDETVRRAATSVQLLAELGRERGVPDARTLGAAGLTARELTAPDAEVTAAQELAVAAALVAALDDPPGLGLEAGQRYHLTTYGIWGFALVSSPTLRAAVDVGLRHLALTYALTGISLVLDGATARLRFADAHLPAPVRRFLVERDTAALRVVQRELAPDLHLGVSVPWPLPADPAPYLEVFGPDVRSRGTVAEVRFDAAELDRPLPRADERTAALAEAQCRALVEARRERVGVADEVRRRLLRDPADAPSMATVADDRHVTERTLRRQLAAEGTSYRALLDEVREALARELLVSAGLSVEQTARRVGFAEPASFVHAFRRWTGMTPGAYRDAATGSSATGSSVTVSGSRVR